MLGGLGGSEIVIIAIIFLVIFGPSKVPQMARDLGRFVSEARGAVDEFKEELTSSDVGDEEDTRRNGGRSRSPESSDRNGHEETGEYAEEDEEGSSLDEDEREEGVYDL